MNFNTIDTTTALPVYTTQQAKDYKDIFYEGASNEYYQAMESARGVVTAFLENNTQPFSGVTPAQLRALFAEVAFDTPLESYAQLFAEVKRLYVDHATAFHLPHYIAHLNCPVVIPALAAEVLIAAINSSQDTWDQSAGGTLMEQKLVQWTCNEIGFGTDADGVFTAGGSQSNLMGMLLARDYYATTYLQHNIRKEGLPAEASRFRFFVSEMSHFSLQNTISLMGLGEKALIRVGTDAAFRMDATLLEKAIQQELKNGNIPVGVVATAGTTDFGNIDPLDAIGKLAGKYNMWFHVDAAYGCGLLLTHKYRHLLQGIEQANSVTTDYHKAFFQPISSSALLVKHHHYLNLITHHADYLNPEENEFAGLNQIDKTITQSTRRFDALKLWCTLRMMGKQKLGAYIDTIIETTAATADVIAADNDFELLCYSDISALVFRYHPAAIRAYQVGDALNQHIKKEMFQEGKAIVAGTRVNGEFYLKFTLLNPLTTLEHIHDILSIVKRHGAAYCQSYLATLNS
ncbi:L-2,4-diaminobutyrate decarboxylase [Filimonas lacunae]|uniref:L-2,4-diaminobutyrate decarboxylase n=1 Tax=Filimonas lacunae TaxID=477680 RepID=A0A173MCS5_9BACT|nr:aspartate aminotransferase family protein [Filimonas lacunae]BAV05326.1 siderophore biosynthesis L-2,4-diaminobutyrate decarboxylase [Filimonas lacunae]SIT21960.1 L-2,4-diaminobutyrate decarboxylase [Filimonas lacunae]